MVAEMITDQLRDCGCDVVGPASSLAQALALANKERLDGALLDINLGGEESFPLARILHARRIPFAFLTGYSDSALPPEFDETPCLTKPFSFRHLAQLVAVRFGPSVLDPTA